MKGTNISGSAETAATSCVVAGDLQKIMAKWNFRYLIVITLIVVVMMMTILVTCCNVTPFSRCMSAPAPVGSSSLLQQVLAFISLQVDNGHQALREPLSPVAASALSVLKVRLLVVVGVIICM